MLKKVYSYNSYIYLNKYQNEKSIINELDL